MVDPDDLLASSARLERDSRKALREKQPQLACPSCGYPVSDVQPVKGRRFGHVAQDTYRRLRECRECHAEFTTLERVEGLHRRRHPAA